MPLQTMSVGVVECGGSSDQIKEQIDMLLALANQNALLLNNRMAERLNAQPLDDKKTHLVQYVTEERERIINELSAAHGKILCQVLAGNQPAYFNDQIVATFWFGPYPRIFHDGEVIVSTSINGHEPSAQVFTQVHDFIYKDLQSTALYRGMMRNPL